MSTTNIGTPRCYLKKKTLINLRRSLQRQETPFILEIPYVCKKANPVYCLFAISAVPAVLWNPVAEEQIAVGNRAYGFLGKNLRNKSFNCFARFDTQAQGTGKWPIELTCVTNSLHRLYDDIEGNY